MTAAALADCFAPVLVRCSGAHGGDPAREALGRPAAAGFVERMITGPPERCFEDRTGDIAHAAQRCMGFLFNTPQSSQAEAAAAVPAGAATAVAVDPRQFLNGAGNPLLFGSSVSGALAHQASFGAHSPELDSEIPLLLPALLQHLVTPEALQAARQGVLFASASVASSLVERQRRQWWR